MFSDRIQLQLDGNKLLHHLDAVESWIRGDEIFPIYVAFSPTSLCNHSCLFCVYQHEPPKPVHFPLERYLRLAEEWRRLGIKSVFFAGDGEPLLNRDCVRMIEQTRSMGIDIALNTNGRLLTAERAESLAENLNWIRISINAGTPENYAKIHRTRLEDFDIVLQNLARLVEHKARRQLPITIGTQCVLLEENFDDLPKLAVTLKKIGVSYFAVKPFLKHPGATYQSRIKDPERAIARLRELFSLNSPDFQFVLRETLFKGDGTRSYPRCLSGPFMIEIDSSGGVYSCGPYLGDKAHCYGNLMDSTFEELWRGPLKKEVMARIQGEHDVSRCMPHCRPDSVNRFLWEIRNPPQHVNYI